MKCCKDGCGREGYERYSCGYYAGRYCDKHWRESGYRDADDRIDPADAGEQAEPEPDCLGTEMEW